MSVGVVEAASSPTYKDRWSSEYIRSIGRSWKWSKVCWLLLYRDPSWIKLYVTEIVVISSFRESGNAIIIIIIIVILDADEIIMLFSVEWLHILWFAKMQWLAHSPTTHYWSTLRTAIQPPNKDICLIKFSESMRSILQSNASHSHHSSRVEFLSRNPLMADTNLLAQCNGCHLVCQALKKRVAFQSYRLRRDKLSASVEILLLEYSIIKDAQGQTQLLRIEE